ncbi:hypothetical protein AMATHDRAFT_45488 [Amanita thiersii Skay4041]|uniref:GPI anchored protein n=1 Tax=Amanita thiersii Skay4041 TaxID=703135 RepID=A0A2A9NU58_9AGAR|nr:hypothetical protein AMATHDRAFT_45488 [Amanita thiersii Skay4041]
MIISKLSLSILSLLVTVNASILPRKDSLVPALQARGVIGALLRTSPGGNGLDARQTGTCRPGFHLCTDVYQGQILKDIQFIGDGCCANDEYCGTWGGQPGCCPNGETCSATGSCPSATDIACADGGCCRAGETCGHDGSKPVCLTGGIGSGTGDTTTDFPTTTRSVTSATFVPVTQTTSSIGFLVRNGNTGGPVVVTVTAGGTSTRTATGGQVTGGTGSGSGSGSGSNGGLSGGSSSGASRLNVQNMFVPATVGLIVNLVFFAL